MYYFTEKMSDSTIDSIAKTLEGRFKKKQKKPSSETNDDQGHTRMGGVANTPWNPSTEFIEAYVAGQKSRLKSDPDEKASESKTEGAEPEELEGEEVEASEPDEILEASEPEEAAESDSEEFEPPEMEEGELSEKDESPEEADEPAELAENESESAELEDEPSEAEENESEEEESEELETEADEDETENEIDEKEESAEVEMEAHEAPHQTQHSASDHSTPHLHSVTHESSMEEPSPPHGIEGEVLSKLINPSFHSSESVKPIEKDEIIEEFNPEDVPTEHPE